MHEDGKRFYLPVTTDNDQDCTELSVVPSNITLTIKKINKKDIHVYNTLAAHNNYSHVGFYALFNACESGKWIICL